MNEAIRDNIDTYQYDTLPDAETYLRLLEFASDANGHDSSISCRLTTWRRGDEPSYHAASYDWGSPTDTERMYLDDQVLMVHKNCADVLRQLLFFQPAFRYYWIDAICINQDDLQEKGHQVAIMGRIFLEAMQVLACIGLHKDDDADYVFEIVCEAERYYEEIGWHAWHHAPFDKNISWLRTFGVDLTRFASAVRALSKRPYFHRVWVVQEFFLSNSVILYCGYRQLIPSILEWYLTCLDTASDGKWLERRGENDLDNLPQEFGYVIGNWQGTALIAVLNLLDIGRKERGYGSHNYHSMDPHEALRICRSRQCKDPRDTIYSTLSMVKWGTRDPIQPDYSKSAFALAVEAIGHFGNEPTTIAIDIVHNLRISDTDADILQELELRKPLLRDANQLYEPIPFSLQSTLVKETKWGYRLSALSHYIVYRSEGQHEYSEVHDRENDRTTLPIAFLPITAKLGDWIAHSGEKSGFVLREADIRFAIIGRAWLPTPFKRATKPAFNLFFDPSDRIVDVSCNHRMDCAVSMVPPTPLLEMLDTAVCRCAFSSYAEIVARKRRRFWSFDLLREVGDESLPIM